MSGGCMQLLSPKSSTISLNYQVCNGYAVLLNVIIFVFNAEGFFSLKILVIARVMSRPPFTG